MSIHALLLEHFPTFSALSCLFEIATRMSSSIYDFPGDKLLRVFKNIHSSRIPCKKHCHCWKVAWILCAWHGSPLIMDMVINSLIVAKHDPRKLLLMQSSLKDWTQTQNDWSVDQTSYWTLPDNGDRLAGQGSTSRTEQDLRISGPPICKIFDHILI